MSTHIISLQRGIAGVLLAITLILASGCGDDVMPVYFRPEDNGSASPSTSEGTPAGECTVSYEAQLCIVIKGDAIDAGRDEENPLCVEVNPFPIHISGTSVTIKGSEFPDIHVEGNDLPAPITINARGDTDGSANTGEGTIDGEGNITVEGFSFFIVALGIVGEIPNLTLTTGTTEELVHLPAISGSPPDASGAMTMVTGTTLGHLIEAADKFLYGASLQAVFSGSITPALSECAGSSGPRAVEITKVIIDETGAQTDANIPDDSIMVVSNGTFIAQAASDVGPRFEASEKFRVKNIGSRTVDVAIPPRIGAFTITSADALNQKLAPQRSFIITVSFRPTIADTPSGEVTEQMVIGTDMFTLQAVALTASGSASVDTIDETGGTSRPNVDEVDVGESSVPVNARRSYFRCTAIECEESPRWTNCGPCSDPASGTCTLLAVSTEGMPLAEVDAACATRHPDAAPLLAIDLKGSSATDISARKQVVAVRNNGVDTLTITDIRLEYPADAQSQGEFTLSPGAIFVADSFDEIQLKVMMALEGLETTGATFPIKLPPYHPGVSERSVYVVVTYQPKDLMGSDGTPAGVGSSAVDKAVLKVITANATISTEIAGSTSIRDVPPLELYFKTSTGLKKIEENKAFSFRQVTAETADSAIPMFLKLSDSATAPMRIASIEVRSSDAAFFEWLDTKDKIAAKTPATGKGMRCSIPIIDNATGQMTGEIFDLNPVALGNGFDLIPGAHTTESMPLFGCINYHRNVESLTETQRNQRLFTAELVVHAYKLDATNNPVRNPDGSFQESTFPVRLLAAINPRTGKLILRITQTMALILNPQFPGNSAIASRDEMAEALASGQMQHSDLQVFLGSFDLDPFDEETITTLDGAEILTTPGDGITSIFRALNSTPVDTDYEDPYLYDYVTLLHDATLPPGEQGIFEGFPNVPGDAKANPWRIFTSMLSYPGPLAPLSERPDLPSQCAVINPCDPEGLKKFTDAGVGPGEKGACAFFYATGGRYDSPAFHSGDAMPGGQFDNMCNNMGKKLDLIDMNTGHYSLDGSINVEEVGLRFFGPTYFHNPGGPLGPVPPMDIVYHTAFTTDTLRPQETPDDYDVVPDEHIDIQHREHMINLDDPAHINPALCPKNLGNRVVGGKTVSSWTYLKPLLSKDENGEIPAGCRQPGINDFNGGTAYLHGRKLNHETGTLTLVAAMKFGSSNDLTFAFKDVMMFIVINGWICDPLSNDEMYEGSRCYDVEFNDRDAASQFSMTEG